MAHQPGFTPTQQKIMDALQDLNGHPAEELLGIIGDEETSLDNLITAISRLRQVLGPSGRTIARIYNRQAKVYEYRLVSLIMIRGQTVDRIL